MLLHEGVEAYKKEGAKFMQWSPSRRLGSKMHDPATGGAAACDLTAPTAPQVI
jgi:hypothetical protein